jgi:hypothetical protein
MAGHHHRGLAHMIEVKTPAGELSDPQQSVRLTEPFD